MTKHLYLTGFRGTGKTSVAKRLAKKLKLPLTDLDQVIGQTIGMSIADYFAKMGEPQFRQQESIALRLVSEQPPSVVSLGGGTVLADGNKALIRETGQCVWLTATVETIAARLATDPVSGAQRPSLTQSGPVEEIRQLLKTRDSHYRAVADFEVATDGRFIDQIADEVAVIVGRG